MTVYRIAHNLAAGIFPPKNRLVRAAVGGTLLAGSALLGSLVSFGTYEKALLLTTAALAVLGTFVLVQSRPELRLLALVCAVFVPLELDSGLNAAVLCVAFLTGIWVLEFASHQAGGVLFSRPGRPLAVFVLVACSSFAVGQFQWFSTAPAPLDAQVAGLGIFVLSAATFVLVADFLKDEKTLQTVMWLFLLLGSLQLATAFIPGISGASYFAGSSGSLTWVWMTSMAFSQALLNDHLKSWKRVTLIGLTVAVFATTAGLLTSWASGWLPPLVGVAAILVLAFPRVGIVLAGSGALVAVLTLQRIISLVMTNEQYSLMTRLEAWRIVADVTMANPLLGLGPANYYFYSRLEPILGWYVKVNSHNNYMDIFAQTGVLGLGCFLWFSAELAWMGWKMREVVDVGFQKAYTYGALGGLAGTLASGMLGDWIIPFVYNVGLAGFRSSLLGWLFLGGLLALGRLQRPAPGKL